MKGYKAFDKNLSCRGFQYEIGKTYHHDGKIKPCESGFHFCKEISDCYKFYEPKDDTRICIVESGDNVKTDDEIKFCTDEITIIEEITDYRKKANVNNTSTGYWNTGDRNTGNWNTGDWNTGYMNTGNRNTGIWNTGNWNTGDWNLTDFSSGCFCTEEPEMLIFDEPSGMTLREFRYTRAYRILLGMPTTYDDVIYSDEQKKYISVRKGADRQKWFDELNEEEKCEIKSMKNFNADKFFKCTGVKVWLKEDENGQQDKD